MRLQRLILLCKIWREFLFETSKTNQQHQQESQRQNCVTETSTEVSQTAERPSPGPTWTHRAPTTHTKAGGVDSETQSSDVSLKTLSGHSHTVQRLKQLVRTEGASRMRGETSRCHNTTLRTTEVSMLTS